MAPGMKEYDEETYLGGRMGTGLATRFNKLAKVRVKPFTLRDDSQGWEIYVNDRHVGTLTQDTAPHFKDRLRRISHIHNEYGCIPLSERYPSTYCGN